MARGNSESADSEEELDTAVTGSWTGGGGCTDIGDVLYSGGAGGDSIPVGDVGHVPTYVEAAGKVKPSGGIENGREDVVTEPGWDVDAPFPGGGDVGGGCAGGGDLRHPPSEHHCTIYCDKAHYRPESGSGATPRRSGIGAVVGTVGTIYRGDAGGGSGGGGGNGLGGVGRRGGRGIDGELRGKGYCSI